MGFGLRAPPEAMRTVKSVSRRTEKCLPVNVLATELEGSQWSVVFRLNMKTPMAKVSAVLNATVTTPRVSGRATLGQRDAYARRHNDQAERNDEHANPEHGVVGRHVVGRRRIKV